MERGCVAMTRPLIGILSMGVRYRAKSRMSPDSGKQCSNLFMTPNFHQPTMVFVLIVVLMMRY